ncbi:hypothetical protein F2Q70_00036562 [Brassica cretica]|uniref:Transmembrane protein n=1 Tax=Brassica cretica TaxID=69181 RepID=A0A8S9JUJ4_BRACR|nr:hypothetical protein F2Q70_00036562 [Brassica cretica]
MSLFRWCRLAADWRIFAVSFSRVIRLDLVQLASVCGSWWVFPTRFCSENSYMLVLSLLLRSPTLSVLKCASLWCWWVHGWARFGAFIFLMVCFVPSQTLGCMSSVMVRVVCFRVVVFLLVVSVAVHIVFSFVDGSGNWRGLVIYGAFCSMWHITQ